MSIASGKRVRAGMALAGIRTATELGRKLSITRQFAARLMSGETETNNFDLLVHMAAIFRVSATWIRTGRGSPSPRLEITPDESRLIELYRNVTTDARRAALSALFTALQRK